MMMVRGWAQGRHCTRVSLQPPDELTIDENEPCGVGSPFTRDPASIDSARTSLKHLRPILYFGKASPTPPTLCCAGRYG